MKLRPALLLALATMAIDGSTVLRAALPGFVIRVPQDAPTIQLGIGVASNGDTVLVSEGIYYENINYRGKRIVVASLTIRDGDTSHISRTVIDGSTPAHADTGSVVSFTGEEDSTAVLYGFTIQRGTGTRFGSIFPPFLTGARVGGGIFCYESGPKIHRIVLQNNALTGDTVVGVGMYALAYLKKPHMILEQCVIRHNSGQGAEQAWGGGASIHGVRGRISSCVIERNTLTSHGSSLGGGLDLWRYRADTVTLGMVVEGNRIAANQVTGYDGAWGGGLISTEGSFRIRGNTVDSNTVRDTIGGAFGGGIQIEDGGLAGPVVITHQNRIRWNSVASNANAFGGGMVLHTDDAVLTGTEVLGNSVSAPNGYGSGLARIQGTPLTVIDSSMFSGNTSPGGSCRGTVYAQQSLGFVFSRNRVEGNSVTEGGGIHLRQSGFRIENSIVRNNGANDGGGIYVSGTPTAAAGGAAIVRRSRTGNLGGISTVLPPSTAQQIINCTVTENAALVSGGGLYTSSASPVVMNCIFWGDTAGSQGSEIHSVGSNLQVRYSDIRLGWIGSGNIDVDPLLVDNEGHLDSASQCIGRGIDTMLIGGEWYYAPLMDREGRIRPNPYGSLPDIGANESPLSLPGGVLRSYHVARGWGMVSVPLTLSDYQKTVVFPTATSEAFAYQRGYFPRTMLENKIGYWLKFDSAQAVPMTGLIRSLDTVRVDTGWNLIGSISTALDTGSIVKVPSDLLQSDFFGYTIGGYRVVGTVEPMHGYWVRARQQGILVFSASRDGRAEGEPTPDGHHRPPAYEADHGEQRTPPPSQRATF